MKAKNIQWDIDFDDFDPEVDELPTEIEIPEGMTDEDEISDYISDQTGFCHKGFELENGDSEENTKVFAVDVRYYIPAKNEKEVAQILENMGVADSEYYSCYKIEEDENLDDEPDNKVEESEEITREMIRMALEKLVITIHNGIYGCTGICCKLGDYAFYFVGTDDQMSVEEYWQSYTKDMTVKMLHDVLKNQKAAEENGIEVYEWKYYYSILNQMYKVEKSEYRLVSLMDGTAMNDQTIIFKTNAPAEELKELERISCEVYLNDGDYEDVPIWETVLNDKGYVFEYVDSSTNCGSEFLEHTYAYVTEHYIIENQPDIKTADAPKMESGFYQENRGNNMETLIEKAKKEYFELFSKVENVNRRLNKPILKELPEILGVKVTQWDEECNLFDGMYGSILITVWEKTDNTYGIGSTVEVFDENDNYIRDLTDNEISL